MAAEENILVNNPTFNLKHERDNVSLLADKSTNNPDKLYSLIFLGTVTGISAIIGFGTTLASARKRDPQFFQEGVAGVGTQEAGVSLALRALRRGTLYAFTGCGLICYGIWKLSGATNFKEFREKMGSILPRIPRNDPPQSRTEFDGLTDLLKYVSEEWGKENKESNK
ncbi:transmembrane protein 242 [Chelonus insularis]|uniref:transmembrane protein 242 n=1 Tax=Chelonus insularis TaxID=460826 RepID=UPI00158DBC24|nr:transmembrane protein 242 [Chelonus insularis]